MQRNLLLLGVRGQSLHVKQLEAFEKVHFGLAMTFCWRGTASIVGGAAKGLADFISRGEEVQ